MTALSADKKIVELADGRASNQYAQGGIHTFYIGQLLMLGEDDGLVKPASGSSGGGHAHCVGVSLTNVAVTSTAFSSGSALVTSPYATPRANVNFRQGIFKFENLDMTDKQRGQLCYAVDDQTVSSGSYATNAPTRPPAGRLHSIDPIDSKAYVLILGETLVSGSVK